MSSNLDVLNADGGFEEEGPRGRVDEDLEYVLLVDAMHARPVMTKEKLRKFLRNYESSFDQQDWTITIAWSRAT